MIRFDLIPGAWGVFLGDNGNPAKLWEYHGINATGEHVFSRGSVSSGTFELMHADPVEFWPLVDSL